MCQCVSGEGEDRERTKREVFTAQEVVLFIDAICTTDLVLALRGRGRDALKTIDLATEE